MALSFRVRRNLDLPGVESFILFSLAIALWCLVASFEAISPSLSQRVLWSKAQYLGITLLPVFWLMFTVQYTRIMRLQAPFYLLFMVPLATLILAWSNELHGLIWSRVSPALDGSAMAAVFEHGTWFWQVHVPYSYLLIFAGVALLARAYVRSQRWDRQHLAVLLAASLIPWATNIVTLLPLEPLPGFDLTPLGFGVSALLLGWALMRYGLLERLPIPYQVVFENLQDAAVVADHRGYVVDLNQAAQHLFGVHPATVLGRPLAFLAPQLAFGVNETHEYRWPSSDPEVPGESIYSVSTTGLAGNRELLITLRDITASHRANGALHRRGRILEAVDFAAEQFLKAALWEDVMDQVLARLGQAAGVGRTALAGNEMRDGELGFRELHAWAAPDWEMEWLSPATTYQRVGLPRWPQAFREGQAVQELPEDERAVLAARGVEAVAALPIFQAGHWWGFLICESRADDEGDFELVIDALKTAVSTLEAVMERSQAEANRMRSAHFQQSLLELTRELLQQEVTPSFYQTILERAIDAVPGAEAGSLLLRGEDSRFRFMAAVGSDLELLAGITVRDDELVGGGEDASSYLLHEAYDPSAYRLDADTRRALETAAAQTGIVATLVVPIVLEGELVASFRLENYQSREAFDAETRRMAEAFGAQIGALLQRARLQARTTQAASANALLADIERLLLVSDRLETFFPLLAKLSTSHGYL